MTASVPTRTTLCLSIAHKCTSVTRPSLSVDVWFCCRRKAVRLSVLVLQPQPGGRNRGRGTQTDKCAAHPAGINVCGQLSKWNAKPLSRCGSLSRRSRAGGLDEVTRDGKASCCAALITGRWVWAVYAQHGLHTAILILVGCSSRTDTSGGWKSDGCAKRPARILMMRAFHPNVDLSARIVHNISSLPQIESGHSQHPSR